MCPEIRDEEVWPEWRLNAKRTPFPVHGFTHKELMSVDWLATQQRERRGTVNLRSSAAALLHHR